MDSNGTHTGWPVLNDTCFRLEWRRRLCLLGNTYAFRFLRLLVAARSQPVSYTDIGERCLGDLFAPAVNIRGLKRRAVARLRASGMAELADAIRGAKEHYWLARQGCPEAAASPNKYRHRSQRSHGLDLRWLWMRRSLTSRGAAEPKRSLFPGRYSHELVVVCSRWTEEVLVHAERCSGAAASALAPGTGNPD